LERLLRQLSKREHWLHKVFSGLFLDLNLEFKRIKTELKKAKYTFLTSQMVDSF